MQHSFTDVDGIRALTNATQTLRRPRKSLRMAHANRGRLPTARDGREYVCTNSGTCYDGSGGSARRRISPMYLLLDALHKMDDALVANPARMAFAGTPVDTP
jgi:hypothetical protein